MHEPPPTHVSAALGTPLSVLDLASVAEGASDAEALRRCGDLAAHAEGLGFHRFWVAEHHNMPAVASSAPDVLAAHVAGATTRMRVGAGGVMLPNHAPLVVAERFAMLEAFHPGRIDLGIGRAPGTDPRTAHALRRSPDAIDGQAFLDEIDELEAFALDTIPVGHRYAGVRAVPGGALPPIWLLGSSGFSAQVAGLTSRPFSFAYHFAPDPVHEALALYRSRFRPSEEMPEPYAMLGVNVVCAPTDEEAEFLAGSGRVRFARMLHGHLGRVPPPQDAATHQWTDAERAFVGNRLGSAVVGSPTTVLAGLQTLLEATSVQELIVMSVLHDAAAHRHGLSLLAEAAGLRPVG